MEIVEKHQHFICIEGKIKFVYAQFYVRQDGNLYSGLWRNRYDRPTTLNDLENVNYVPSKDQAYVPTKDQGPEANSAWSGVYIKTPNLLTCANGGLERQVAREAEICEILRKHPHPNIATYYGHTRKGGRVSGLCFKRYTCTLLDAVNPHRLSKSAFLSSGRELVREDMKSRMDGLFARIRHLHSLGIVHNDINPNNIMVDEDGSFMLIDFDSCRYIGEPLRDTETKRTHHWHDPAVDTSLEKNDLDAFRDIQVWLTGSADEGFLF